MLHLERFAALAEKHSECPTALEGVLLDVLSRGQLYPELDAALFDMGLGEIVGPVRTQVEFYLLLCEAIGPRCVVPAEKAMPRIKAALRKARVERRQRAWLAGLLRD